MLKTTRHFLLRVKSFLSKPRLIVQEKYISDSDIVCENPIMVFGIHRSGTSLFRRILNSHSQIACPPETYFFKNFVDMAKDDDVRAGFAGLGYIDDADYKAELYSYMSRYHSLAMAAQNKKRWADKTPQYVHLANELKNIMPEGTQSIIIFRHPFDIVSSIYSRKWRFGNYDSDLFKNTVLYVKDSYQKLLAFEKAEDCISFKYEDLVENPELELKRVFEFLDEPWESSVLDYNAKVHNVGTEDPIVTGANGFFRNSGNWQKLSRDEKVFLQAQFNGLLSAKEYESE